MSTHQSVAVFDSGLGGLTVLRALRERLPQEDFFYFADTRFLPYGDRPETFLKERGVLIADGLARHGAKALVIACNTATAAAAEAIRAATSLPVVALEPGVKPAAALTKTGAIGVLATTRTLASERFQRLVGNHANHVRVVAQACPGLAEAIETEGPESARVAALLDEFVAPLAAAATDVVVLGCTHYPWVSAAIAARLPAGTTLLDTGEAVARQLERLLAAGGLLGGGHGRLTVATSGAPQAVGATVDRLWGGICPLNTGSPEMSETPKPLTGLKVVELGTLIAGPFCSRILAEFGAEVVKVEAPDGGDPLRQWRKLYEGTSLWWYVQARNKKSVTANLKHPEGKAFVRRLIAGADILVENFRPGVLEKLGLSWESLRAENPGLVMVRLSGFGQSGPYKDQPGFGAVGESMGGLRYITGFPDRPPVRTGISIGDSIAALWGAIGALMALRHREVQGGQGQVVDVALYEAIFAMMESLVPEFDVFGFIRERTGNIMPGITPSNTHTTRDGKHVTIGANGDAIFKRLMRAMGRNDLAEDPGLADNAGRDARRDEIYGLIDAWCAAHDETEVLAALEAAEVPASRVYSVADMFADPQFLAREMIQSARLPDGKAMRMPGIVPKLSATPGSTEWLGPTLGEHTDAVLAELGYGAAEIAALRAAGAI